MQILVNFNIEGIMYSKKSLGYIFKNIPKLFSGIIY